MIAENHAALSLLSVAGSDEQLVRDLNFRRTQGGRDLAQGVPVEDVSTLDADDLARLECISRK